MNAHRSALALLVAGYALVLGGCATNLGIAVPPGFPPGSNAPPDAAASVARSLASLAAEPAAKKGRSSTYAGTVTQTEGSMQRTGSLKIVMMRSGTKISGTFAVTFGTKTTTLDFSGTAKGKKLTFTIVDKSGCNAKAHAKIKGRHLNGSAQVPPCDSQPTVYITFKTLKQRRK
jgi:hypothetical protein